MFLLAGIAIGPQALGLIDIKADSALNQIILLFGASYILFDGGASLRLARLEAGLDHHRRLATIGVLITAGITGLAAHYILGIPLDRRAVAGRDAGLDRPGNAGADFPADPDSRPGGANRHERVRVQRRHGRDRHLRCAGGGDGERRVLAGASLVDLLKQSLIGIVAGIVLGYLAALLIAHERWAFLAEYAPVVTLVAVIGAYFAADGLQASGFMAVFVFGIMLGNKETFGFAMEAGEAQKLDEFVLTTAFIMRLFIFILLGAQVDFTLMGRYWPGGAAVVAVLMLVARPATVFLCAWPDRRANWSFAEMLFMCWTRETGVIPAALAGLLLGMKAPGAQMIASVTFIAILMTILIQAPTTRWLARRLGLLEEKP